MIIFTRRPRRRNRTQGQADRVVIEDMRKYKIPVYMIRTGFDLKLGDRFRRTSSGNRSSSRPAAGSTRPTTRTRSCRPQAEIDKLSAGRIDVREYTAQRPRFDGYALVAVALWLTAGVMKLGFRTFRTFP